MHTGESQEVTKFVAMLMLSIPSLTF